MGGVFLALRMKARPQPPPFAQPTDSETTVVTVANESAEPTSFGDQLERREGEHPLAPLIRVAEQALEYIDAEIQDYSATLVKRERVGGKLLDPQTVHVKIRHQPFSAYLYFIEPFEGQECLFVEGQNNGNMLCRAGDWRRSLGIVSLKPHGLLAMNGQKYPIVKIGIRNLTDELKTVASEHLGIDDCLVSTSGGTRVGGRPVTMIEVTHSQRRPNLPFSQARVYIDNELGIPIRYASWTWPDKPGEDPQLEEEYSYTDLRINNGFSDGTFSQENPELFR